MRQNVKKYNIMLVIQEFQQIFINSFPLSSMGSSLISIIWGGGEVTDQSDGLFPPIILDFMPKETS